MPVPEMLPVANTIQPPNPAQGLNTLSSLIDIQQRRQQLQTGQYLQQTAQANATMQQQSAREIQGIVQLLQDPSNIIDDDGNPRPDAYQKVLSVAPTMGATYYKDIVTGAKEKVAFTDSLSKLNDQQRQSVGTSLAAVAARHGGVPDYVNALNAAVQANPTLTRAALVAASQIPINTAPTGNPQADAANRQQYQLKLDQYGAQMARAVNASNANLVSPAVSTIQGVGPNGKPGLVPTNLNPMAAGGVGPVGPAQAQSVAPGGNVITDAFGRQFRYNPQTNQMEPVGTGLGPSGQNAPTFAQPYPGQGQDIQNWQTEVQQTRNEAQQAPLAHNINRQILQLSRNASTGPGSQVWQSVLGGLGAPFGISPSAGYQELGKFLEKNAIQNMQGMGGPPSDARLSAAAAANGSTSFSPTALQAVTKFNDATTTGLEQYRQGIDRAVGTGQNVDYTKLPAFKAAWAKNFDVDIFRVENAIRDGDTAELAKLRAELGPQRMQQLAIKRQNLTALSQTGQLPQTGAQ